MRLILWKIYFWILTGILVLGTLAEVSAPSDKWGLFLFDAILLAGTCFALYGYIYKKMFLTPAFWKHFLYFNVAYGVVYLIYALFPNAPYIENLSILSYNNDNLIVYALLGVLLGLPSYFAFYRLSQGQFYEAKAEVKTNKPLKWNMFQIALWGYGSVMSAIFFITTFFPSAPSDASSASTDISQSFYGVAIVAPLLIFWLWIVLDYKKYKWNWWKITLVLNSILYSALMVIGLLFAEAMTEFSEGTEVATGSGYDIIATLQFLIIFIALQVFGREQFQEPKKPKPALKPSIEKA